jgi:hypothetical protein
MKLIKVTAEHIKAGKMLDPYNCPVGLALREQCGLLSFEPCIIGSEIALIGQQYFTLPIAVKNFLKTFDRRGGVSQPFAFDLPWEG